METLGALTDKLSIVNAKLFSLQDLVHRYAAMAPSDFAEIAHADIHDVFKKLKALNLDRNRLIGEIDSVFATAIQSGIVPMESRTKIV